MHVDIDDPNSRLPTAEPAGNGAVGARSSFLELAKDRFEARNGRPATVEEETWTFDELQAGHGLSIILVSVGVEGFGWRMCGYCLGSFRLVMSDAISPISRRHSPACVFVDLRCHVLSRLPLLA